MAQQLPTDYPIDPTVTSGTALADILNRSDEVFNSTNSGPTRPATIKTGGLWAKTGGAALELFMFDGTTDIPIQSGDFGVSTDAGNMTVLGTDGLVYTPLVETGVSTDAGNITTLGTDGLVLTSKADLDNLYLSKSSAVGEYRHTAGTAIADLSTNEQMVHFIDVSGVNFINATTTAAFNFQAGGEVAAFLRLKLIDLSTQAVITSTYTAVIASTTTAGGIQISAATIFSVQGLESTKSYSIRTIVNKNALVGPLGCRDVSLAVNGQSY